MCGIVGFLSKTENSEYRPLGLILLNMLKALGCRGPDSAGVAIFGRSREPNYILRIKLPGRGNFAEQGEAVAERLRRIVPVHEHQVFFEYLRVVVGSVKSSQELESEVEGLGEGL